ncbi:MAG: LysR family transcriptional regulator [Thiolinea sp.]
MSGNLHRKLSLKQLQLVSILGRELSLSKAAELLHTSSPALSRSLNQMEQALGLVLFERTTRSMKMSSAGLSLFRYANSILGQLEQAQEELEGLRGRVRAEIRIGIIPAFSSYVLGAALGRARELIADVAITIQTHETDALYRLLSEKSIDLMLSHAEFTADMSTVHIHELYQERSSIVCHPGHPLSQKTTVTAKEVASCPWILPPPEMALRKVLNRTIFVDRPPVKGDLADIQADSYPLSFGILKHNASLLMILPQRYATVYEKMGVVKQLNTQFRLLKGPMCCFTTKHVAISDATQVLIDALQDIGASYALDG